MLIVDDQPGIRLLLKDIFTIEGYNVTLAHTGMEALENIYEYSYDIVMLDYQLPILNGNEVLEQMMEAKINVPVILMSGLVENIQGNIDKGDMAIEIVAKPFNLKDIIELVNSMTNQSYGIS